MTLPHNARKDEDAKWLTPGVASIGAASFFSDAGHEIATSVVPAFLTTVLGGSAATLGLIEGVSDALTGAMKVIGGPLANDPARRRRLATGGYIVTAAATAAIGFATAVWQVGVLRALAWGARGVRSPARDALLGSLARPHTFGRAFGLERAGDNLGAVVGPLLAAVLVAWLGLRPAIWLAFIPGMLAAVAIIVAAREAKAHNTGGRRPIRLDPRGLRRAGIGRPLLPVLLFECGNLATTLLILRATDLFTTLGFAHAASLAILLYAGHNAVAALVSLPGGYWLDRVGPRRVFASGAIAYVFAYGLIAVASVDWVFAAGGFLLAGAGIGLAETAESAFIAQMLPDELRGSGFGVVGGIQAVGNIVGTVVAGVLYATVSPATAFAYAGAWMILSVAASILLKVPRAGGA
ncbi:MFS transporter [Leifsonia virtsii]|uniref:MFS transporter n=1 Tax=Leifsonia virtsii TaxID=3035915 RepID=A0ABT8IYZ1_9MICO|nr:MFS transporter [Leifsonia virtsii]MDN4598031.1 MFS transporter [Leifsonia virtsii]